MFTISSPMTKRRYLTSLRTPIWPATERAQAYLEKVVQIRLDLPPLLDEQVSQLTDAALQAILERHGVTLDNDSQYRLASAYQEHMRSRLSSPRANNRFFAQVDAVFGPLRQEVDFVGFLLINYCCTFEPKAFDLIRDKAERRAAEPVQRQEPLNLGKSQTGGWRCCGVRESTIRRDY